MPTTISAPAHPTAPAPPACLTDSALTGWTRATVNPVVAMLRRAVDRLLWRPVLAIIGPLHVEGLDRLPPEPCVLVADHCSHLDAIAIRSALARGGRHRVVAAAAEDHWFTGAGRPLVAVLAAGGFPLPRHGQVGLERAAGLLAAGHDVVLFPQGSRDGSAQDWRCGAGRLAVEAGATLVPIRLYGTDEVLPKGARRPRPHPMALMIGDPVRTARASPDGGADPRAAAVLVVADARAAAGALDVPAPVEGRLVGLSVRLRRTALRRGVLLLALWAFAEAMVWPLIPDLLLAGMSLAVPRLAPRLVAATVAGSAAGGATALLLGRAGLGWPLLAVTRQMEAGAAAAIRADGAMGVLQQPLSGIPYKAFNAAAMHADIDVLGWIIWTPTARGARMAVVALVAAMAGRLLWSRRVADGWAPRIHALVVLSGLTVFLVGWAVVVSAWR